MLLKAIFRMTMGASLFIGCETFALPPLNESMTPTEPTKFAYLEVDPQKLLTLSFFLTQSCVDDAIRIKEFRSITDYPGTGSMKKQKVRIENIYVSLHRSSNCRPQNKSLRKEFSIQKDEKNPTHLYVTFSNDLQLSTSQSKK